MPNTTITPLDIAPTDQEVEYFVIRVYADGKRIGNHVWTTDIADYARREESAVVFPTTVVTAVVCDDFWTCDHHA